jgi:hypothetical protein
MLYGVAALARIQTINCNYTDSGSIRTFFNEFLLVSKHGVRRARFGHSGDSIGVLIKVVFFYSSNIIKIVSNIILSQYYFSN